MDVAIRCRCSVGVGHRSGWRENGGEVRTESKVRRRQLETIEMMTVATAQGSRGLRSSAGSDKIGARGQRMSRCFVALTLVPRPPPVQRVRIVSETSRKGGVRQDVRTIAE